MMSNCIICNKKETRSRPLLATTNICTECTNNINTDNYEINEIPASIDTTGISSLEQQSDENDRFDSTDREKEMDINDEEDIVNRDGIDINVNENYKDALLASLYSQIEFLRNELEEKNFLIRTLLIKEGDVYNYIARNSNDGDNSTSSCTTSITTVTNIQEKEIDLANEEDISVTPCTTFSSPALNNIEESEPDHNNETMVSDDIDFNTLYLQYVRDRKELIEININNQLNMYRSDRHEKFISTLNLTKCNNVAGENHTRLNDVSNNRLEDTAFTLEKTVWTKGTVLITGDSLVLGLQEKKMGKNVKVRGFSGGNINDFYTYLIPLLRKKPSYIILMVGTNDATMKSSEKLLAELLALKNWILEVLPEVIITISCPTIRNDNQKARLTILHLRKKLNDLKLSTIINDNIGENHLGRKGLHLNNRGSARLAMNYLAHIRRH